jgi:hypothetical protein
VAVTDKLFFRKFHYFLFIHASGVQGLGTSGALEYWHGISADSANVTVVQWASEVKRISVYIFKQFFGIIFFNTFRMEVFGAIGCWAFSHFVSSLYIFIRCLLTFLSLFLFPFFILLVLGTIIKTFGLTYQTCHQIIAAIFASPVSI